MHVSVASFSGNWTKAIIVYVARKITYMIRVSSQIPALKMKISHPLTHSLYHNGMLMMETGPDKTVVAPK